MISTGYKQRWVNTEKEYIRAKNGKMYLKINYSMKKTLMN